MAAPTSSAWASSSTSCSTGRRPFQARLAGASCWSRSPSCEPRPPRQIDDAIPKELERICLKALAKRASERYTTAKDLADDLRHFLAAAPPATAGPPPRRRPPATPALGHARRPATGRRRPQPRPVRIVPKGLRSFDAHDADFFLELLPGPRDRDGLPDSIRFWKTRIEETDPDETFRVGLIYGPSGCGKSSLVKAGLLPRLSDDVIAVYVEATADETEARLLNGLRKRCPALPDDLGLTETLAALRRGQGLPAGQEGADRPRPVRAVAARPRRTSRTPSWCRPCGSATAGGCSASSWSATTSGWPSAGSCASWRSASSRARTRPRSTCSTRPRPQGAGGVRPGLRHAARATRRADARSRTQFLDQAVAGLAQDGKVISRAAGPVRRDDEGQAVDARRR